MAYLAANRVPVVEGRVSLPAQGRGSAELRLAADANRPPFEKGAAVTLAFQDGTRYQTTCLRAGPDRGAWKVLLVQGAGKLSTVLPARFYQDIPKRTVATDLLEEAGEVAGDVELEGSFPFWTRLEEAAKDALATLLLGEKDVAWWCDGEGRVVVKAPQQVAYPVRLARLGENAGKNSALYAGTPNLTPQHTIAGRPLVRVVHLLEPGQLRTGVWFS